MDKLGIVFSGRVKSALLGALGLWILLVMGSSAMQIIGAYLGGDGFDATVHDVIMVDVFAFLPYFLVAAVLLRSLTARLALFHKLRRQIVTPEYSPPEVLSPAEAGLLIDDNFAFNEIAATLKDLELRGCVTITENGLEMQVLPADLSAATDVEKIFIRTLCIDGPFATNNPGSGALFLHAGQALSESTRQQLVRGGQLSSGGMLLRKVLRIFVYSLLWLALLVQVILTWGVVAGTHEVFSVGYPRYPMSAVEPILEVIIVGLALGIVFSGFWQRTIEDDKGLKNWRYVAGLKMYLEKVYKDRFYRDNKQIATQSDMRTFYPYAIALGIEKRFTDKLKRALVL